MAATIIHFGADLAARIPVLQSAGFQVDTCSSIDSLIERMDRKEVDAVVVPEQPWLNVDGVVSVTRSRASILAILFAETQSQPCKTDFDLVVPAFTLPQKWLADIMELMAQSKALQAESQRLQAAASALRGESSAVRQRSAEERERTKELTKQFSQK